MTSASEGNGSYFDDQALRGELNPFQAFGLPPDDFMLTQHGARLHYEVAAKHVSETGDGGAVTKGARVPRYEHLEAARASLIEGVTNAQFERLKFDWAVHDKTLTWNPFAPVGSDAAKQPPTDKRDGMSASSLTVTKRY